MFENRRKSYPLARGSELAEQPPKVSRHRRFDMSRGYFDIYISETLLFREVHELIDRAWIFDKLARAIGVEPARAVATKLVDARGRKRRDDALAAWPPHHQKDAPWALPETNELRGIQKEPVRLGQ